MDWNIWLNFALSKNELSGLPIEVTILETMERKMLDKRNKCFISLHSDWLLAYEKAFCKILLRLLIIDHKCNHVTNSKKLLALLNRNPYTFLRRFKIANKIFFYHKLPSSISLWVNGIFSAEMRLVVYVCQS